MSYLLVLLLSSVLPFFIQQQNASPKAPAAPNIVVILADDLGGNDLACFGSADMKTPNVDGLAKDGMRFVNFYSNSSVCSPTRASLLTGCYPERVGVPGVIRADKTDSWGNLSDHVQLLPAILSRKKYHTALIGKWHLGLTAPDIPNEKGFHFFHGFLGDMMDDYHTHLRYSVNYLRLNKTEIQAKGHATDLFSDWAVQYIRSREGKQQPFFLYLAYNAPHDPIQPTEEWLKKVKEREPGMPEKRAKLLAMIEHMDDGIGKVIDELKRIGVYEHTLIIFSSDNGGRLDLGANNGPVRSGKGSMYEGGLRVPAIVSWPGKIKAGSVSEERCLTMDLFPTILEAAGISYQQYKPDGVSLYPVITGEADRLADRPVFFCRREGTAEYGGKTIEAVIKGDWKLLQNYPFAARELYYLKDDPKEQNNLIGTQKEKFREMEALLRRQIQSSGSVPWQ